MIQAKKMASAALAGILAMGMCVPAVGVSTLASMANPAVAVAAEGAVAIEPVYTLDLTTTGAFIPEINGKSVGVLGDYSLTASTLSVGDKTSGFTGSAGEVVAVVDVSDFAPGTYPVVLKDGNESIISQGTLTVAYPTLLSLKTPGSELARMTADNTLATGTEYTAIKVFSADITGKYGDEEAPKAANIAFANGVTADLFGITATGDAKKDAQTAAEFIGVTPIDEDGTVNMQHQPGTGLIAGSYGMELAKKLMAAGAETKTIKADNGAVELDGEGYYLIVRTSDLTGENTAASSPIFAALDGGETEIMLKVAIPTITKEIQEDGADSVSTEDDVWGDEADHTLNQDVNYRLTGTVAENIAAFEKYEYQFNDSWDGDRMSLKAGDASSVKVSVDGTDVTAKATISYVEDADADTEGKQSTLTVSFEDLLGIEGVTITPDTKVVVTYTAYQNAADYKDAAAAATDGIENTANLEYSNNPVFDSKGYTPDVKVKDFSYSIRLNKTDNATGEALEGVEFSFVNKAGLYLGVVDGKLVESTTPYSFATDANGDIHIYGVDADDYTVVETKKLAGYEDLAGTFVATIDAADRAATTSSVASDNELFAQNKTDDTATVSMDVKNVKEIPLPSTGEMGIALIIFLALSVAVIAVVRRRREEKATVMSL